MIVLVLGPGIFRYWALDVQGLADLHVMHVGGHWTVGVDLDEEIHVALVTFIGYRSVWSYRRLLIFGTLIFSDHGSCSLLICFHG